MKADSSRQPSILDNSISLRAKEMQSPSLSILRDCAVLAIMPAISSEHIPSTDLIQIPQ